MVGSQTDVEFKQYNVFWHPNPNSGLSIHFNSNFASSSNSANQFVPVFVTCSFDVVNVAFVIGASWSIVNGKRRKFDFLVHSSARAQQTNPEEDAQGMDELDLVPGHKSRKEFLKSIGLKGEEDFARSRLYFVPDSEAKRINDYYISNGCR